MERQLVLFPCSSSAKEYCGTLFKISRTGMLSTLYTFCSQANCDDGSGPEAALILGTGGDFYGTTTYGGANNRGTVFRMAASGALTTLYSFCAQAECADGTQPLSALVEASDGSFYGTTSQGGSFGCGTVFKIAPSGALTTLHQLTTLDGCQPTSGLIQSSNGNFYGTANQGGTVGYGTVFTITPAGKLTTLYNFDGGLHGSSPWAALIQGVDGNFYGTTTSGGTSTCFGAGCGTVFKITSTGNLTTLHSFDNTDANFPFGMLARGTDGNLYGTTSGGGNSCNNGNGSCGTVFQINSAGTFTTLHSFDNADGATPLGGLLQATNGSFYGTTTLGGDLTCDTYGCGSVFSLSVGLGPFVAFVRSYGKVGQTGPILGQGFTEATNVSLNGTSIPFTVKSDTLITATAPAGATTGPVIVTTPTGALTSNVPFRVLPQLLSFTPTSGPVGTQVTLTGVSFTQTTGVGFGDYTPAPFTANSDMQVTATVPTGAKTGPLGIQTSGGIAISTQVFTVTK